jgi:hypothetical protein
VYGSAYANELRDIFPAVLILFGAPEMEILRRAEEWSLLTTRRQESFDQASGSKTLSSNTDSTLDYRRLLPTNRNRARLVLRGTPGIETELEDWSDFTRLLDEQARRTASAGTTAASHRGSVWTQIAERHHQAVEASRGPR